MNIQNKLDRSRFRYLQELQDKSPLGPMQCVHVESLEPLTLVACNSIVLYIAQFPGMPAPEGIEEGKNFKIKLTGSELFFSAEVPGLYAQYKKIIPSKVDRVGFCNFAVFDVGLAQLMAVVPVAYSQVAKIPLTTYALDVVVGPYTRNPLTLSTYQDKIVIMPFSGNYTPAEGHLNQVKGWLST